MIYMSRIVVNIDNTIKNVMYTRIHITFFIFCGEFIFCKNGG
jgi:hypothetical protein